VIPLQRNGWAPRAFQNDFQRFKGRGADFGGLGPREEIGVYLARRFILARGHSFRTGINDDRIVFQVVGKLFSPHVVNLKRRRAGESSLRLKISSGSRVERYAVKNLLPAFCARYNCRALEIITVQLSNDTKASRPMVTFPSGVVPLSNEGVRALDQNTVPQWFSLPARTCLFPAVGLLPRSAPVNSMCDGNASALLRSCDEVAAGPST
jgi:hypothetical protein